MNRPRTSIYDLTVIEEVLPHRNPFLFVDRVVEWVPGEKIVAERDLREGEPYFAGHFPGRPIMPGVLVSEALAQASGLLLGLTWRQQGAPPASEGSRMLYLAGMEMKYLSVVGPGDTLTLRATLAKTFGTLYRFEVDASAGSTSVARGKLTLACVNP